MRKSITKKILKYKKITAFLILLRNNFRKILLRNVYNENLKSFIKASQNSKRFDISKIEKRAFLNEQTNELSFDPHYVYHSAWAARVLAKINPKFHTDISSHLNFIVTLSAFIPVKYYDFRPANLKLSNLTSKKANLLNLHFPSNSIDSLSCMHTIEHVGLGRYGDPIDPDGDLKAINELKRVLALNGDLLFVVPIGKPKIVFNAHRVYSYDQIISYFKDLKIVEFTLISNNPGRTSIIYDAKKDMADLESYGCGCFWFKKTT